MTYLKLADRAKLDAGLSTAVTGETGGGKTTFLKLLAYQMPLSSGTAVVAHDLDSDFQELFADLGLDVLRLRKRDSDAVWNLFLDIEHEDEYYDIASAMMGSSGTGDNAAFFHNSATQILEAILTHLHREGQKEGKQPTHEDIKGLTLEINQQELHSFLAGDFPAVASFIEGDSKQALGVYSTLVERLNPILTGDFAESGSFSLRDYIADPRGRVLIVDSDVDQTDSMGPIFRLVLDMSIRFAMTDPRSSCNFILDEIDQLPPISMLPALASKGRSRNARCLIGIQTKGQLESKYGQDTDGVLGNCPQEIHFSPGDSKTIRHIRNAVGKRMTTEITHSTSMSEHGTTTSASESRRERNPVSEGALNDFSTGDAVVINQTSWWIGHVAEFSKIRNRLPCGVDPDASGTETGGGTGDGGSGGSPTPTSMSDNLQTDETPALPRETDQFDNR